MTQAKRITPKQDVLAEDRLRAGRPVSMESVEAVFLARVIAILSRLHRIGGTAMARRVLDTATAFVEKLEEHERQNEWRP